MTSAGIWEANREFGLPNRFVQVSILLRMARTVSFSVSLRTRQYLIAGWCCGWPAVLGLAVLQWLPGVQFALAVPVAVGIWLTLTVAWVRRWSGDDDGSAWDAIPRWQYGGWFAGQGGLVKEEQDEALGNSRDDN